MPRRSAFSRYVSCARLKPSNRAAVARLPAARATVSSPTRSISPSWSAHSSLLCAAQRANLLRNPLRDEALPYGEALHAAGNAVTVVEHHGLAHGFISMAGALPGARLAQQQFAQPLRAGLAPR